MTRAIFLFCFLFGLSAAAQITSEPILPKGKGVLTCTGGSQNPLFNRECKTLSINRINGGSIKYEINCVDSNNVTFMLACDSFVLEVKQMVF